MVPLRPDSPIWDSARSAAARAIQSSTRFYEGMLKVSGSEPKEVANLKVSPENSLDILSELLNFYTQPHNEYLCLMTEAVPVLSSC